MVFSQAAALVNNDRKWDSPQGQCATTGHVCWPGLTPRSRPFRRHQLIATKRSTVKKVRKNYSPQEKVSILRSHLVDKVSALQLCAEFQLQPKIFYGWLKRLFDNGPTALKRRPTTGKLPDASRHGRADLQEQLRICESREDEQSWMISLVQGVSAANRSSMLSMTHSTERRSTSC